MLDKIKIYVTAHTAGVLAKDAEAFEFYKRDGRTLNRNAFLTALFLNFRETYQAREDALFAFLKEEIGRETHMPEKKLDGLCYRIASHIHREAAAPHREKFDSLLTLKPTRESAAAIDYAEEYSLAGCSLSEYFRNLFSAYASMPQDEREKIVFRPQYEALQRAIDERRKVFLTTAGGAGKTEAAPYALACSKEELHCYLLAVRGGACIPFRLSRIRSVTPLKEVSAFTPEQEAVFAKMLAYGPQFYYGKEESPALVRLTARGAEKFAKMYVHRPVPDRVENNDYYFSCSLNQLFLYFCRFGKDAYAVYPEKLRRGLFAFHKQACSAHLAHSREKTMYAPPSGKAGTDAPDGPAGG